MVLNMLNVTAKLEEGDVEGLMKAIDYYVANTNKSVKGAVSQAGYQFLRSARAGSPIASGKNRRIERDENGEFYRVMLQHGKSDMKIRLPRLQGSKEKRARVRLQRIKVQSEWKAKPNYKASRQSWAKAFNDLGKNAGSLARTHNRKVQMASMARKMGLEFSPEVRILNSLVYLPTIAPNLEHNSLIKAGNSLAHNIEKGIESQKRRWESK